RPRGRRRVRRRLDHRRGGGVLRESVCCEAACDGTRCRSAHLTPGGWRPRPVWGSFPPSGRHRPRRGSAGWARPIRGLLLGRTTVCRGLVLFALIGLSLSTTGPAMGQTAGGSTEGAAARSPRATLMKLSRVMSIEVTDQRLEDVIEFISSVTTTDIEPAWKTDTAEGLDKDKRVTLKAKNARAMNGREKVLAKAQNDFQQNTWQVSDTGTLEIGPKDRLNKHKRLVIYDINDLLSEIPSFYDVPQIDLQGVLQQSGRAGG